MELKEKYRCKYSYYLRFGRPAHQYELVGVKGGIHLQINDYGEDHKRKFGNRYSAGLEIHYRNPPEYMRQQPPSHDECWLLKCPCWHDGTTQYAEDYFLPKFISGLEPDEMLHLLMVEAEKRFNESEIR